MKIIVFGATGGIGQHVVEQALSAGHDVTIVVRWPTTIPVDVRNHPHLHIFQGDVLQPDTLRESMLGQDVVISSLGARDKAPTVVYSQGVANIMQAMQKSGVKRLMCISASGLEPGPMWQRIASKLFLWRVFKESFTDLVRMETLVKASSVDWTIVRPPRLNDKPHTGLYHYSVNDNLKHGWQISRADLADFLLKHIADPAIYCSTVEVAW